MSASPCRIGSITAVLGANGAGKTHPAADVSGLVRPHRRSGHASPAGRHLTRMPVEDIVRLGMAHVPEGRGVIQELTVEENLRLGALWRRDRADRKRALGEMYALFAPWPSRRHRSAFTLSGGERQMLVLGRALMGRPRVLLLDEPSLGLAPLVVAHIMALLRDAGRPSRASPSCWSSRTPAAPCPSPIGASSSPSAGWWPAGDAAALAGDADLRHHYLGF